MMLMNEILLFSTGFAQLAEMEAAATKAAKFPQTSDAAAGSAGG